MKDERLNEAFQTWEALSGTREQRIAYEGRMKQILDEASIARDKELWEQDKQLLEEAQLELEKAKIESQERMVETARKLLKMGMDVDAIVMATQLSEKQVLEIQQELN